MTGDSLLRAEGLSAAYQGREVFAGVSLGLGTGLYALTGANGSGKSTLLRLLAGAQQPDGGEVWIDGLSLRHAPEAARRRLAYVPDTSPIYPFMTGRQLFRFVASARRTALDPTLDTLAGAFGLNAHLDARFDAMSFGTQKKMLLCTASIGAPRVVLLDEPGGGLDRPALDGLVTYLIGAAAGATILFATHDQGMIADTNATVVAMADIQRQASR